MEHFVPNAVDGSGNITSWVLGSDGYEYDALNRVTAVSETATGGTGTGFTQKFLYDRWGNRTIDVANTTNLPGITRDTFTVSATINRLTAQNGVSYGYDSAGNQTTFSAAGQPDYELRDYDAENRMTRATKSGVTSYYHYDGSGKRVRRVIGGAETWQVYGFEGELVAEYTVSGTFTGSNAPSAAAPVKEYGYRGGQMLVVFDSTETGDNQLKWLVQDHLGSTRMLVNRSGSLTGMKRRDYLPFGEELASTIGHRAASGSGYQVDDKPRMKFTGKERDTETGLDYFHARYYSSMQGRFTSPDEFTGGPKELFFFTEQAFANPTFYADLWNPQSLNKYQYAYNNSLRYVDPDGHMPSDDDDFWESIKRYVGSLFKSKAEWKTDEEAKPKEREPGILPSGDKIVEGHFKGLTTNAEVLSTVIEGCDFAVMYPIRGNLSAQASEPR